MQMDAYFTCSSLTLATTIQFIIHTCLCSTRASTNWSANCECWWMTLKVVEYMWMQNKIAQLVGVHSRTSDDLCILKRFQFKCTQASIWISLNSMHRYIMTDWANNRNIKIQFSKRFEIEFVIFLRDWPTKCHEHSIKVILSLPAMLLLRIEDVLGLCETFN